EQNPPCARGDSFIPAQTDGRQIADGSQELTIELRPQGLGAVLKKEEATLAKERGDSLQLGTGKTIGLVINHPFDLKSLTLLTKKFFDLPVGDHGKFQIFR